MARIDDIAYAIMKQEGSVDLNTLQPKPGSVNYTMVTTRGLWNVGHIVWAGQNGAKAVKLSAGGREWAGWPTYHQAYQGLINQITLDANRGDTIRSFVEGTPDASGKMVGGYAPASENKSEIYIAGLSSYLGASPDTKLSDIISGAPTSNPTPAPPEKPNLEGPTTPTPLDPPPPTPPTSGGESNPPSLNPPPGSPAPLEQPSLRPWWRRLLEWWLSS